MKNFQDKIEINFIVMSLEEDIWNFLEHSIRRSIKRQIYIPIRNSSRGSISRSISLELKI